MPFKSGLIVVLRIAILIFLFNVLSWVIPSMFLGNSNNLRGLAGIFALFAALAIAVYWLSPQIIEKMMPDSPRGSKEEPITGERLQVVAFAAVGVYIIYVALTQTVSILIAALEAPAGLGIDPGRIAQALISWAFGLFLLLGSDGLVRLLKKLRQAGT